jgi:hypothetical protein
MSDGKGCKCHAHCEHECCCDADWTPKEVYDLRADLAQRTAEVAKANAERDEARAHFRDAWRERSEFAKRIDEADADLAQRTAERDALAAEVAALTTANASLAGDAVGLRIACAAIKAERDEARRDLCMSEAIDRLHDANPNAPISRCGSIRIAHEIAVDRGWDCFKEEA